MPKFTMDKDKKVLILTLLCFLGTGTGIGVFMGGQALLDLASPPNRNFSTGGGLRASLTSFFMGMIGEDDNASSANPKPTDAEPQAFLTDDSNTGGKAGSDASSALTGGDGKGGAGVSKGPSGGAPGKLGGQMGAVPSGAQSASASSAMSGSGKSKDLVLSNSIGKTANGSKNGRMSMDALRGLANSAHDADLANSASAARGGLGNAWGDANGARQAYEGGALSKMDQMKASTIASLKSSDPKSLVAPDTGKLNLDADATKKDSLNSQLNKALSGAADASSGVANSLLSGVSSSLSGGVSGASTNSSSSGTGSSATSGLSASLSPDLKSNLDAWGVPSGRETFTLYKQPGGGYAAVYEDGCQVSFAKNSKTGQYEAVDAVQGTHSCKPGTISSEGCNWQ